MGGPLVETMEGRLGASTLYTGKGYYPKRWTLKLDGTGVIRAYLKQMPGTRLEEHEGWNVRVTGHPHYKAELKTYILEVTSVENLPGGEPAAPGHAHRHAGQTGCGRACGRLDDHARAQGSRRRDAARRDLKAGRRCECGRVQLRIW